MSTSTRVIRNTLANWIGIAVGMLVLVLLVPFLKEELGAKRFGIYGIASQSLLYVNLLTLGMRGAVTRLASKDIAASNLVGLNQTLSSIFLFYLGVGALGLVVCTMLGVWAPAFFDVSAQHIVEARVLFIAVGVGFLFSVLGLTFTGVLVGHQRYDLINVGSIIRDVVRGSLIVGLFLAGWNTLGWLGVALAVCHGSAFLYLWRSSHRQQPGLRIRPSRGHAESRQQIFDISSWNAIVQVGNVVTFATPTFIVAKIFGTEMVELYFIPFIFLDRLRVVVAGMADTLAPVAAATLVTDDRARFRQLLVHGTRAAATMCFPVGLVLLFLGQPLFDLYMPSWTAGQCRTAWMVCAVLLIAMFGRISQAPTLHILIGGGKLKGLAIVQAGSAVATIILTVLLASCTSLGVVGVAIGVALPLFLSHTVFLPWYAARQAEISIGSYLTSAYGGPILAALPCILLLVVLPVYWEPSNWMTLGIEAVIPLAATAAAAWFLCIDADMRYRLLKKVRLA